MSEQRVPAATLDFLKELKENNNREWFETNKARFRKAQASAKEFFEKVVADLRVHDDIEQLKQFRIYRDVRFSPDKTPYKPHFAVSFSRNGGHLRGGYYLRIRPGESFAAVGFWGPEAPDLLRIRKELELDASEFLECIHAAEIKNLWGELKGECVKTAPKGFDRNHPNIDLIRHKQFIFTREFTDREVLDKGFADQLRVHYQAVRPWFDLMSQILTTNLDGESLLDQ